MTSDKNNIWIFISHASEKHRTSLNIIWELFYFYITSSSINTRWIPFHCTRWFYKSWNIVKRWKELTINIIVQNNFWLPENSYRNMKVLDTSIIRFIPCLERFSKGFLAIWTQSEANKDVDDIMLWSQFKIGTDHFCHQHQWNCRHKNSKIFENQPNRLSTHLCFITIFADINSPVWLTSKILSTTKSISTNVVSNIRRSSLGFTIEEYSSNKFDLREVFDC